MGVCGGHHGKWCDLTGFCVTASWGWWPVVTIFSEEEDSMSVRGVGARGTGGAGRRGRAGGELASERDRASGWGGAP